MPVCPIPLTSNFIWACRTLILFRYFRTFWYNLTRLSPAGVSISCCKIYTGTGNKSLQMLCLFVSYISVQSVFIYFCWVMRFFTDFYKLNLDVGKVWNTGNVCVLGMQKCNYWIAHFVFRVGFFKNWKLNYAFLVSSL